MKKREEYLIRRKLLLAELNRLKNLKLDIKIPSLLVSIRFTKQFTISDISKITGLTKQRIYQIAPHLLDDRDRGKLKNLKINIRPNSNYVKKNKKSK